MGAMERDISLLFPSYMVRCHKIFECSKEMKRSWHSFTWIRERVRGTSLFFLTPSVLCNTLYIIAYRLPHFSTSLIFQLKLKCNHHSSVIAHNIFRRPWRPLTRISQTQLPGRAQWRPLNRCRRGISRPITRTRKLGRTKVGNFAIHAHTLFFFQGTDAYFLKISTDNSRGFPWI